MIHRGPTECSGIPPRPGPRDRSQGLVSATRSTQSTAVRPLHPGLPLTEGQAEEQLLGRRKLVQVKAMGLLRAWCSGHSPRVCQRVEEDPTQKVNGTVLTAAPLGKIQEATLRRESETWKLRQDAGTVTSSYLVCKHHRNPF